MDIRNFNFHQKKGVLLVLLTAVISGISIFVNSIGVKEFDSSVFAFLKNLTVGIFMLSIIIGAGNFHELRSLKRKNWLQLALIGLVGGSIPFLLYFRGLQMTTGALSGFIHKSMFIFIGIFAVMFLREKITKGVFLGALLLMAGNYLILKPGLAFTLGHAVIFAAVLFWAAENTYSKHVLKELSGNAVAFGRIFFGAIFILGFLLATGKAGLIFSLSTMHWMWIGITSLFLLLYVVTFYNGLKHIKVTTAACILSLGQPITMLLSFAFKGKLLTAWQGLGMLLVLVGVASVIAFSKTIGSLPSGAAENGRS